MDELNGSSLLNSYFYRTTEFNAVNTGYGCGERRRK
jgi:hypothetical protein